MSDPPIGWDELASSWERERELLWQSTRAVSEWLVDRLAPEPGQTILELAAGTGETGFLAAQRISPGGTLISSDGSEGMLAAGRRRAADWGVENVEFRVLDIEATGLPDASVDGVLCRYGYILRGSPPAALPEIRRVLRPGGRLAFAVWAERERNGWMTVPTAVMVARGHMDEPIVAEFRSTKMRSPEGIAALLAQAGFGGVEIEELEAPYRFADAAELWFFIAELRGPVSEALAGLDEAERDAVRHEIERQAAVGDGRYELGGVSINVVCS